MDSKVISYHLNDYLCHMENNNDIPQELIPYLVDTRMKSSLNNYISSLNMIIENHLNGINTNEMAYRNFVKYIINTLNVKNCDEIIKKIYCQNLKTRENLQFLANELIIGAMTCPLAIRGLDKGGKMPLCELIIRITKNLCANITKENIPELEYSFNDELLKLCRKYFMDFVDITNSMDKNNENTADNYKGFMTYLGLLLENNLISYRVILDCIESILMTIFCTKVDGDLYQTEKLSTQHQKMFGYKSKLHNFLETKIVYYNSDVNLNDSELICYRDQIACGNYYKGYVNLMYHFIKYCEIQQNNSDYLNNIIEMHNLFKILNNKFKVKLENGSGNPLKVYIIIVHDDLTDKLNKLRDK